MKVNERGRFEEALGNFVERAMDGLSSDEVAQSFGDSGLEKISAAGLEPRDVMYEHVYGKTLGTLADYLDASTLEMDKE